MWNSFLRRAGLAHSHDSSSWPVVTRRGIPVDPSKHCHRFAQEEQRSSENPLVLTPVVILQAPCPAVYRRLLLEGLLTHDLLVLLRFRVPFTVVPVTEEDRLPVSVGETQVVPLGTLVTERPGTRIEPRVPRNFQPCYGHMD